MMLDGTRGSFGVLDVFFPSFHSLHGGGAHMSFFPSVWCGLAGTLSWCIPCASPHQRVCIILGPQKQPVYCKRNRTLKQRHKQYDTLCVCVCVCDFNGEKRKDGSPLPSLPAVVLARCQLGCFPAFLLNAF